MSELKLENRIGDQLLNISAVNREFRSIAVTNDWQAYHTPKNLAAAISVEAAELLAEFQWLTPIESAELDDVQRARVASEVADVVMYISELCIRLNIDIAQAIQLKTHTNKERFAKK